MTTAMEGRGRTKMWYVCLALALSTGALVTPGVGGELTVDVYQLNPDVVYAGDVAILRCTAEGQGGGLFLEWGRRAGGAETRLAANGSAADPRYSVSGFLSDAEGTRNELLLIPDVDRRDAGLYYCHARTPGLDGAAPVLQTDEVHVYVLYFPSEASPVCTPDGPVAVAAGGALEMSCASDRGNPLVQLHMVTSGALYVWRYSHDQDTARNEDSLTASAADDGNVIECKITSAVRFPGTERSCFIGPITVTGSGNETVTARPATNTEAPLDATPTDDAETAGPSTGQQSPRPGAGTPGSAVSTGSPPCGTTGCPPASTTAHALAVSWTDAFLWIVIAAAVLFVLLVSVFVNVVLAVRLRHAHSRLRKVASQVREHPYMELDAKGQTGARNARRKPAKQRPVEYFSNTNDR